MRTLKIVMLTILLSVFFASCTDLINNDDHAVMTKIENTNGSTSANSGDSDGGTDLTGGTGSTGGGNGGGKGD